MSDKNKKELIEKATGWSLAIFVYGTAIFYFAKHALNLTGDDLDAYISMLSVGATLFAGFIAIYLFSDWKIQHNKTLLSDEAKQVYYILHNERVELYELKELLRKKINTYGSYLSLENSIPLKLEKIVETQNINRNKLGEFTILSEDQELHNRIEKVRISLKEIIEQDRKWRDGNETYKAIGNEYDDLIEKIKADNYNCILKIKTYIFME